MPPTLTNNPEFYGPPMPIFYYGPYLPAGWTPPKPDLGDSDASFKRLLADAPLFSGHNSDDRPPLDLHFPNYTPLSLLDQQALDPGTDDIIHHDKPGETNGLKDSRLAKNNLPPDPGRDCHIALSLGLSHHLDNYERGHVPDDKEIDLWKKITDNDSRNYIGGRMPNTDMEGYDQFSKARDQWLRSGEALRGLKAEIGEHDSAGAFEIMMSTLQDYLARLEGLKSLAEIDSVLWELAHEKGMSFLVEMLIAGPLEGKVSVLKDMIKYLIENVATPQDFIDFFEKVYEDSYNDMLEAYARMVKANRTDNGQKAGGPTRDNPNPGTPAHKLCPDDEAQMKIMREHHRKVMAKLNNYTNGDYQKWIDVGGKPINILRGRN
jgi:hypothetical protein